MEEFFDLLKDAIIKKQPFRLTLSKPRKKHDELRNVFFRPVMLKDNLTYQANYRYKTKDQTKNYSPFDIENIGADLLREQFFNADLFLSTKKITLLQSKKGKSKVLSVSENHEIEIEQHDHNKRKLIDLSSGYLHDIGITSTTQKIYAHSQDKYKQINKYIELIEGTIKEDKSVSKIVDMGCGKGYLTFALYDYLSQSRKDISVKGVEIRKDLIEKCNTIAQNNKMENLSFELGSIDTYSIDNADMVIALHACDIATDMAIAKGLEANAKYIIMAPCCHKQIRKAMTSTDSTLSPLLQYGILKERQAEMITDTMRALILESKGYNVRVFEFISSEHTGKNVMITAVYTGKKNSSALDQLNQLKKEFGIDEHYLERLV